VLDSGYFAKSKVGTARKGKNFSTGRRRREKSKKDEARASKDIE
jgi:hypothetical protein